MEYQENRNSAGVLTSVLIDKSPLPQDQWPVVPLDNVAYLEWCAAGNTPRIAPPATLLIPTWNGAAWVEDAPLADVREKKAADLISALGDYQHSQYPAGVLIEIEASRGRGAHAARVAEFDAWKASVLTHYRTALAAINTDTGDPVADLATVQAATWDFAQFDATNPHLTLAELSA